MFRRLKTQHYAVETPTQVKAENWMETCEMTADP